jgi:hypothetical protein
MDCMYGVTKAGWQLWLLDWNRMQLILMADCGHTDFHPIYSHGPRSSEKRT